MDKNRLFFNWFETPKCINYIISKQIESRVLIVGLMIGMEYKL